MSTETHVFFRGKLPSKAALARAMKELGFPFAIKPATGSLDEQSGFMPMTLRREETGVEFDVYSDHAAVEEFAAEGVAASFERRASFRWSGDFQEAVAGMCAAAALAKLMNGVVFDEAENRLLSVDEAIAVARRNLKALPEPTKERLPRRQAVIRRLLAPLLAKRDDLVLVGPLLLIRPVRHLIRGAEFRWHDRGATCSVARYVRPLYQPSELFLQDAVVSGRIADPDFEPMLFDGLAAEIFEPLGKIATIEDFIESRFGKRLWSAELLPSILLSRGIEQAKAHVAEFVKRAEVALAEAKDRLAVADRKNRELMYHRKAELKHAEETVERGKRLEAFVVRGEVAAFAHYRAWEAEVARGYKIEHAWEQSPFPAERVAIKADPTFSPTPWLDFPDTWRLDPPEDPGEVRFARDWWDRQGRVSLLYPITREQSEACHRNFEHYVLATRLPERQLLILVHMGSSKDRAPIFPTQYVLRIYDGQQRYVIADFREDREGPSLLKMVSLDIRKIGGGYSWHSYVDFDGNEVTIRDNRTNESGYVRRKMTDAERAAYAFALPRFGEFGAMWDRICMHLHAEGVGMFK